MKHLARTFFLLAALSSSIAVAQTTAPATTQAAPKPKASVDRKGGVYAVGDTITFETRLPGEASADYSIRLGGQGVVEKGRFDRFTDSATVTHKAETPGWYFFRADLKRPGDEKPQTVYAGAVVDWPKMTMALPAPDDFDQFWKDQLDESAKLPLNAVLTEQDSGDPAVAYYLVEFDNISGKKVRGQFARPKAPGKYPATIILPWAGVYGLPKGNVVGPAKQGYLALNVLAHDLPINETEQFYKEQNAGPLRNYIAIGNTSRETTYFRPMIVGCLRAARWLGQHEAWDGKSFVAQGTSQGGLLSGAVAALHPQVTHWMTNVPAGCDSLASEHDRLAGWPFWKGNAPKDQVDAVLSACRYYDTANFASRVKVPTLMSVGLIDTVCPPTAVIGAFNAVQSDQKELLIMAPADHNGTGNTHQPYYQRSHQWMDAIRKTGRVP